MESDYEILTIPLPPAPKIAYWGIGGYDYYYFQKKLEIFSCLEDRLREVLC